MFKNNLKIIIKCAYFMICLTILVDVIALIKAIFDGNFTTIAEFISIIGASFFFLTMIANIDKTNS